MFREGECEGKVNDGFCKFSFIFLSLLQDIVVYLFAQEEDSATFEKFHFFHSLVNKYKETRETSRSPETDKM